MKGFIGSLIALIWLPTALASTVKDTLILDSGELLIGELLQIHQEHILFDSDVLGELEIDLEDVAQLTSEQRYQINLDGQGVIEGTISLEKPWLVIQSKHQITVATDALIALYPLEELESHPWEQKATLSASFSGGNSHSRDLNGKYQGVRLSALRRTSVDYLVNISASDEQRNTDNHRLTASHDIYRSQRWFLRPIQLELYHAPLQNIRLQTQLSPQLGYIALDNDTVRWELAAGPSWQQTRFKNTAEGQSDRESSLGAAMGSRFSWELSDSIELKHDFSMSLSNADTGGYQHHSLLGVAVELAEDFDLDVDFIWDYIEQPALDSNNQRPKSSDYRTVVGLGLSF